MALFLLLTTLGLLLAGHQVSAAYLRAQQISADQPEWSYDENGINGPKQWCKIGYRECCGKSQSPVNINVSATKYSADHLTYENYDISPDTMELHNNGHSVELISTGNKQPSISFPAGGSVKRYSLDNVHFHWGKLSARGSEHTIDDASSPMEMHFVHEDKNTKSVAVIGVFFKISKHRNHRLNTVIDSLKLVKYLNDEHTIPSFKYSDLLPNSHNYFFTYHGSLTIPPCTENVQWVVMDTKVSISEDQINEFRQLQTKTKNQDPNNASPLVDNYRPLQELNCRQINRSKKP